MGNNIKTVSRTEQLKQRENDAMEKIRYLRNKEKRHAEKMERVQNEEFHKQILGTLEEDFNHNFVDPLKDWTESLMSNGKKDTQKQAEMKDDAASNFSRAGSTISRTQSSTPRQRVDLKDDAASKISRTQSNISRSQSSTSKQHVDSKDDKDRSISRIQSTISRTQSSPSNSFLTRGC